MSFCRSPILLDVSDFEHSHGNACWRLRCKVLDRLGDYSLHFWRVCYNEFTAGPGGIRRKILHRWSQESFPVLIRAVRRSARPETQGSCPGFFYGQHRVSGIAFSRTTAAPPNPAGLPAWSGQSPVPGGWVPSGRCAHRWWGGCVLAGTGCR